MEKNARRRGRCDLSSMSRYIEAARIWLQRRNVVNRADRYCPDNASSTVLPSGSLFSTIYAGSHGRYSGRGSD